MRDSVKQYVELFEKTLNLSGICWWIIDFTDNPDFYYCNDFMVDTFSLDKKLDMHSIEKTCPIAGDYYKNIEEACENIEHARIVIDEYKKLLNQERAEYNNKFPYYSKEQNKTLYFSSRAKVLERDKQENVSILYGIIEDITIQEEQKQKIEELVKRDKLTNLYNRAKLDDSLLSEINSSKRYDNKLSLVIIDIDNFKLINDTYGHLVGDNVLIQIQMANIMQNNARESDIVGRWGGEEFIVICPNSDIKATKQFAEKLRTLIEKFEFDVVKNKTASFGVAEFEKEDTVNSLLNRADKALYRAKELGRNRVET